MSDFKIVIFVFKYGDKFNETAKSLKNKVLIWMFTILNNIHKKVIKKFHENHVFFT